MSFYCQEHTSVCGVRKSGKVQTPTDARSVRLFYFHAVIVCLHCPTPRPIKNGLWRIVWMCSYCTETDDNTDSYWVLYLFSVSVSLSSSGSVNEP